MIKYYVTSFGVVFVGFEFVEIGFDEYKVIVPADKLADYRQLKASEKTIEKIRTLAWVFPASCLVKVLSSDQVPSTKKQHVPFWWEGELDRTTMFIIGAGASANCVVGSDKSLFEKDVLRPPLGNGLFKNSFRPFYQKYEGVKLSLFDLQRENINVEEFLENEWHEVEECGNQLIMNKHINIQFYVQEVLSEVSKKITAEYFENNLFAKLADHLQKMYARDKSKRFSFVSFNQDTILEDFLSRHFQLPMRTIDDYVDVNTNPFSVFKPHGSWDWGWPFRDCVNNRQEKVYALSPTLYKLYFEVLGDLHSMVDWAGWGRELSLDSHRKGRLTVNKNKMSLFAHQEIGQFYPAILLPYRDKDEFTMPSNHFERLETYLNYIETLFIIGWKGNEKMFNRILHDQTHRIKKVVIVDPNPSVIEANLKDLLSKQGVVITYYNGFDDFIARGLDQELAVNTSS